MKIFPVIILCQFIYKASEIKVCSTVAPITDGLPVSWWCRRCWVRWNWPAGPVFWAAELQALGLICGAHLQHNTARRSCGWWSACRSCPSRWRWRCPSFRTHPGDAPGCCLSSFSVGRKQHDDDWDRFAPKNVVNVSISPGHTCTAWTSVDINEEQYKEGDVCACIICLSAYITFQSNSQRKKTLLVLGLHQNKFFFSCLSIDKCVNTMQELTKPNPHVFKQIKIFTLVLTFIQKS